ARIAYFFMDSVQQGYEKVRESGDRFRNESRRLEQNMQREMQRAQGRYEELMRKDHTYSTQAEVERDQAEVQQLMGSIQELQARSERELAALEVRMLSEISLEIEAFLEEYNEHAGFDYILSVQDGGQIWVGNDELDITSEVLNGLNSRHRNARSRKEGAASPAQP
ncbi:MAG: OmpH family outer membrane protein, partial [Flavobacteriales bacterium]|nr:OmpH family outer membrane protein [Flavobacteriales bacterium]